MLVSSMASDDGSALGIDLQNVASLADFSQREFPGTRLVIMSIWANDLRERRVAVPRVIVRCQAVFRCRGCAAAPSCRKVRALPSARRDLPSPGFGTTDRRRRHQSVRGTASIARG